MKIGRYLSIAVIVCCCFLLLSASFVSFFGWNSARYDVVSYWDAALRLRNLQPLYASEPVDTQVKAFIYPPVFAALFAPFTLLPTIWGYSFWLVFQLIALVPLLLLCVEIANKGSVSEDPFAIIALILLAIIAPLLANVMEGQTNILVVSLVAGTLVALKRDRSALAALLLALATQLKIIPSIIFLALLLNCKFRECIMFLAFTLCLSLLPALWLLPHLDLFDALHKDLVMHLDYFHYVLLPGATNQTVAGANQLFAPNYSIYATLSRYFGEGVSLTPFAAEPSGPLFFPLSREAISAFSGFSGLLLFYFSSRRRKDLVLCSVLFYLCGTVLNVTCWEHHLIALALLVAVLIRELSPARRPLLKAMFVCLPIILSLTIPSLLRVIFLLAQSPDSRLADFSSKYSLPLLAVLISWFFVAATAKRKPDSPMLSN